MKTLSEIDKKYRDSISSTYDLLCQSFKEIQAEYSFDLSKKEVSDAILERLKNYYLTQEKIKSFLQKDIISAGADYFVETTLFYLKLYIQSIDKEIETHSEKRIKPKRGSIRPDITVWRKNEVIAIIECKTQLGWNRSNWEIDFSERERKLKLDFPNSQSFLLVMTGGNWPGFEPNQLLGDRYFCLLKDKMWPTQYTGIDNIMTPIEDLFKQILKIIISNNFPKELSN